MYSIIVILSLSLKVTQNLHREEVGSRRPPESRLSSTVVVHTAVRSPGANPRDIFKITATNSLSEAAPCSPPPLLGEVLGSN